MAGGTLSPFLSAFRQIGGKYAQNSAGIARVTTYAENRIWQNESLDIQAYTQLWKMGRLSPERFKEHLAQLGFRINERLAQTNRYTMLGDGDRATLNRDNIAMGRNDIEQFIFQMKQLPTPDEALLMLNRRLITMDLARWIINQHLDNETVLTNKFLELRHEIPGPSDLIRFAVRDAFDPQVVARFGYNKDLPVNILPWMEKQGLGGEIGLNLPPNSTTTMGPDNREKAQWFDMYWWSHWDLPSPTQGFEMLHRLYEDTPFGKNPFVPNGPYFTRDDLDLLLKASDYPQFWRDRLTQISYHPLTRVDTKRMYKLGILKEDANNHDVYHSYRQQGYDHVNAERMAQFVVKDNLANIEKLTVSEIDKNWNNGALTTQQVRDALQNLGYTPIQIDAHIRLLEFRYQSKRIEKHLDIGKRGFFKGIFSTDELRNFLTNAGVNGATINENIEVWTKERELHYKQLSAKQWIIAFKRGSVNEFELLARLNNLMFTERSIRLMIDIAKEDMENERQKKETARIISLQKAESARQEQIRKSLEKTAKNQEKAIKLAATEQTRLIKLQLSAYSDKNIISFYQAGFLSVDNVIAILRAKGWDNRAIDAWITTNLKVNV